VLSNLIPAGAAIRSAAEPKVARRLNPTTASTRTANLQMK
jgi:hypothetical protein